MLSVRILTRKSSESLPEQKSNLSPRPTVKGYRKLPRGVASWHQIFNSSVLPFLFMLRQNKTDNKKQTGSSGPVHISLRTELVCCIILTRIILSVPISQFGGPPGTQTLHMRLFKGSINLHNV